MAAALAAVLVLLAIGWKIHRTGYERGMDYVHQQWDAERIAQRDAALAQSQANARETLRRMERQEENQRALDQAIADARRDAARASAAAERLREQNVATARAWRDALRDSPAGGVCQAAGAAIDLQTDVQRRLVAAGGELAAFADAARAAGLKCGADYGALKPPP
jgi:RNA polymerase-binding transcription factor DksA